MPKFEPKLIQKELDQGLIWPVYWLYGAERMKSRELLKRIRTAVLGQAEGAAAGGLLGLAEETLDGQEVNAARVVEAALSPALGGGTRLIVVRDAHALKDAEGVAELLGPRSQRSELASVCVFLSKDLDGRKKVSKLLLEKAAVVPCEEVLEADREDWIQYLSKRRGISLSPELIVQLASLDPWSLDIIDQEMEKFSLAPANEGEGVILSGVAIRGGAEAFLEAFFNRDLKDSLERIETFADKTDEALPLLGLLAWNVRQLAWLAAKGDSSGVKLNPYAMDRLRRWVGKWPLPDVLELQKALAAVDFEIKQTALLPLGTWSTLAIRFCC